MIQFASLLRRFSKDESGVFAVLFGLMAIVLIALGGVLALIRRVIGDLRRPTARAGRSGGGGNPA